MLIEAGNWNGRYRCRFSRYEICHNNVEKIMEMPPWIKDIQGNTDRNQIHHEY